MSSFNLIEKFAKYVYVALAVQMFSATSFFTINIQELSDSKVDRDINVNGCLIVTSSTLTNAKHGPSVQLRRKLDVVKVMDAVTAGLLTNLWRKPEVGSPDADESERRRKKISGYPQLY